MAPFAFVQATPSRTPCANGLPTSEVIPVRSKMPPTLISCCARAEAATQRTNSASRKSFMVCASISVRERIQAEPVADTAPEIGQAVGLEGEEDRAEDGAEDAPEAADDDHPQVVDGHSQREVLRADDPRLVGEQRSGDA